MTEGNSLTVFEIEFSLLKQPKWINWSRPESVVMPLYPRWATTMDA